MRRALAGLLLLSIVGQVFADDYSGSMSSPVWTEQESSSPTARVQCKGRTATDHYLLGLLTTGAGVLMVTSYSNSSARENNDWMLPVGIIALVVGTADLVMGMVKSEKEKAQ